MKLPKTEKGRTALAWKLLDRLTRVGWAAAGIRVDEPLAAPGIPRRWLQVARLLLDAQASADATKGG